MTDTRIIKKYANRRLYDTGSSKSIKLSHIREMIVDDIDFRIVDDTTGDDITRALLLQIIVEQEQSSDKPLLTERLLAQLIRFNGKPTQGMMVEYIQKNVSTFVSQQRSVQSQMQDWLAHTPIDIMRELVTCE